MADGATLRERVEQIHENLRAKIGAAETDLLPAGVWLDAARADSGLQVTPLPASDPLLSGAFAALDRETGAIWLANNLPELRRPTIIAHEFGHFYLHPDLEVRFVRRIRRARLPFFSLRAGRRRVQSGGAPRKRG